MQQIWAKEALLPDGWAKDVCINIANDGRIARVTTNVPPPTDCLWRSIILPAPVNAHSHAFQRVIAGLTETRGPNPRDTFWTWRQRMFHFLAAMTPDDIAAIAALVQMEMLEAGYATNVEFHYLHHTPDGTPYNNLAEMAHRIIEAATQTGIGLTLLPVQYQFGGLDRRPLGAGQVRFGNDPAQFARLCEEARRGLTALPADTGFGVAPHSLRAVDPAQLAQIAALANGGPVHMHLAEQMAEVAEVQAGLGARPVAWMLDNTEMGAGWCLIHCTQMQPDETMRLAATGAVAGLCPITESSLGDGIFDGLRYLGAGGQIAIGSDSNIRISLSEELRTLEYSQRLRDLSRAALATPAASTGRRLFDAICAGGAQAAGRASGAIAPGLWADLLALDGDNMDLQGITGDTLIDTWVFAGDDRMVSDVWAAGRHMVQNGRHVHRAQIVARYAVRAAQLRAQV